MNNDLCGVPDTDRQDVEYAAFALGRFVQYRLDDGMAEADLEPFMQAYLNLTADLDGRERLSLHALRSQTAAARQAGGEEAHPVWPFWLQDHEALRYRLRTPGNNRNTDDLDG